MELFGQRTVFVAQNLAWLLQHVVFPSCQVFRSRRMWVRVRFETSVIFFYVRFLLLAQSLGNKTCSFRRHFVSFIVCEKINKWKIERHSLPLHHCHGIGEARGSPLRPTTDADGWRTQVLVFFLKKYADVIEITRYGPQSQSSKLGNIEKTRKQMSATAEQYSTPEANSITSDWNKNYQKRNAF